MALSETEVARIADYARIKLTDSELSEMTVYMNDAVAMLEPILNYTHEEVAPTFHPIGSLVNVMREDAADALHSLSLDAALDNAAASRECMFRVPSILGEGSDA